jgi:hypothetical protein
MEKPEGTAAMAVEGDEVNQNKRGRRESKNLRQSSSIISPHSKLELF